MSCLEPKIYIVCLAAYNNGHLHGKWIDANQSPECLWEEIREVLKTSPIQGAEEWAIHDYEDFQFGNFYLKEDYSLDAISEMASFVVAHGKLGIEILRRYTFGDIENAKYILEDCYQGEYSNTADFAETLTEEITAIPDNIAHYIDYEKMGRDWLYSGDYFSIELNGKVHIFRNE